MTRLARCDISSAGRWLNICSCRCFPLGAGCCFGALGYNLLGCCRSNRWLYCGSSGYLLISFWGWWSGDGLSSHFNLGMCVRSDRIWVTFMNVVLCSSILSSTNDFDNVWAMISCTYYSGREHSVLSLLITETDCPAYSGAFLWQPVWSWLAALWVAHSYNLWHSAAAWGSLCLILYGTVVCRAC